MSHQITLSVLRSLEKSAQEESLRHAGDRTVAYTRRMKMLGMVGCALFLGVGLFFALTAPPAERWLAASCFGVMFLLPLALALEAYVTRITYDELGIRTRSAWRPPRFIPFTEIESCDFSLTNRWYRIRTRHYGIIRLSIYMRGVADLLRLLPCPHPGYPPVSVSGDHLGSSNEPQVLPATTAAAPAMPVKMTGAKVIGAIFCILGLGAFACWPMYRMPERSQFTEIEGQVTEMSTQATGKNNVLLKVRMTNAPALLTWSSVNGTGANLRALFNEMHRGDPITVLVLTEELAQPPQAMAATEPQIWIAALRSGQKEYLTFENHLLWHRGNRNSLLRFGILLLGLGLWIFWDASRKERRLNLSPATP